MTIHPPWIILMGMGDRGLPARIGEKGADPDKIADQAIDQPALIPNLIAGLNTSQAKIKYACEKALRKLSEKKPALIYPHFDVFADLLEASNSFLKWGAITTIANLAGVDSLRKIDALFSRYCAPIKGPAMITAANVIGSLPRIALARPELAERIAAEILKVETASYELRGCPSPECRNVAIAHALSALGVMFESLKKKKPVLDFVRRQLDNPRAGVRKAAAAFLRRHG
jgi:hypothetical protein